MLPPGRLLIARQQWESQGREAFPTSTSPAWSGAKIIFCPFLSGWAEPVRMVSGTSALKLCREGDAQSVTATVETPIVELPSITYCLAVQK